MTYDKLEILNELKIITWSYNGKILIFFYRSCMPPRSVIIIVFLSAVPRVRTSQKWQLIEGATKRDLSSTKLYET